jgi:hypothetical protein
MNNFDLRKFLAEGRLLKEEKYSSGGKLESYGGEEKVTELAAKINNAIASVEDSASYTHFAQAVAKVVRDEYGNHLYSKFAKELIDNLK